MTFRVAGLGELLWDRFPDGDRLGGAPANFAFQAGQLGAEARIVSRIGFDADGDRLVSKLKERGVSTEFVQQDPTHPTGLVRVELKEGQPAYVIENPAAWDFLEMTPALSDLAGEVDALCFGTLAQRHETSRRTIQDFVRRSRGLVLFDLNFRQVFYNDETIGFGLAHASAVKLNHEEISVLARLFDCDEREVIPTIFRRHRTEWIAVTRGAAGCELHTRTQQVVSAAPRIECVDAVGAGDAFSAALVMGLLQRRPLEEVADHANRVGAFVASQPGAMPVLASELLPR